MGCLECVIYRDGFRQTGLRLLEADPALGEQIKKAVAQVGPMVFVKQMLTFRLTEVGVHEGEVWDAVMRLSQEAYEDPEYVVEINRLADKYNLLIEDDEYSGDPEACVAFFAVSDGLVMGLDESLSKLPYLVCESLICQVWPDDKMYKGVAWIMDQ